MLSDTQLDNIISKNYDTFIEEDYEEFSKDYEKTFVGELEYRLMFDEYVRQLPDRDIENWIYKEIKDYDGDVTGEDVAEIRRTISRRADLILEREHKNFMYYLTHGGNKECALS